MVDDDLNAYLIEVNTNPCLSTLSDGQNELINKLVSDTIQIAVVPTFGLSPKDDSVSKPQHTRNDQDSFDSYQTEFELIYNYFF